MNADKASEVAAWLANSNVISRRRDCLRAPSHQSGTSLFTIVSKRPRKQ